MFGLIFSGSARVRAWASRPVYNSDLHRKCFFFKLNRKQSFPIGILILRSKLLKSCVANVSATVKNNCGASAIANKIIAALVPTSVDYSTVYKHRRELLSKIKINHL